MKLQRTTLILLVTASLLGGFVYFYELQGAPKREAAKTTKQPIFAFKEDQIQSLTINRDEKTLEIERVSGKETGWRMKTPKDVPASNASVAFLLNLLVEGKSDRSFPIKTNQLSEYGLDKPAAMVKVKLKNQQTHQLILGKPDFNRSFLYAQTNPSIQTPQSLKVLLVPIDFEYAVNRPMSEWQTQSENSDSPKASPTPESSKPSPTPASPTASPTPESSKPSPTPAKPTASPTPESSKPSPTPASPKASPSPESSKPSPTPASPKVSPSPESSKPSPTPASPKASPTPDSSKPSPTPASPKPSPKPSPIPAKPKPSPTPDNFKPDYTNNRGY